MKLLGDFLTPKFAQFLLAGGTAALVNILSRILYSEVMPYAPAVVAAYVTGMATAYVLNRLFVFGAGDRVMAGEIATFVLVKVLAVAQTLAISLLLARWALPTAGIVEGAETLAHIVGVVVPVFTSYLGHKYWTFRNHRA